MRPDSLIYLISEESSGNAIGDAVETTARRAVHAERVSVRQSEFYQAAAAGLKPELAFIVWTQEYEGEQIVEFEGNEYDVDRTYRKNIRETELICSGLRK